MPADDAQTYHTRVQSKIHSLANLAPMQPRVIISPLSSSLILIVSRAARRSGQPLPEPRFALYCAVAAPAAPQPLHRQI